MMNPEELITYCGVYGDTCASYIGYPHRRHLARTLAEWVDACGCQHWMPELVKDFDYNEFRKGLDYFSNEDSETTCHKCCKGGDSNPECEIRLCCQQKKLDICTDCSDFPCKKLRPMQITRLSEYRELGKDEWLCKQVRMAEQGYELHTGMYYQINSDPLPFNNASDV